MLKINSAKIPYHRACGIRLKNPNTFWIKKVRVVIEAKPIAVYFKYIRREPLGTIQNALQQSLPSSTLLGLSFVGHSELEITLDKKLKQRLVATLGMIRVTEISSFDIYEAARKLDAAMTP